MRKNLKYRFLMVCMISVLSLLFFNAVKTSAATVDPNITYDFSKYYIVPGDEFKIYVNISNNSNLYGASIDLKFDPTIIEIKDVNQGNLFSETKLAALPKLDNTNGLVSFFASSSSNKVITSSSGTLFTLTVKAKKDGFIPLTTCSDNRILSLDSTSSRIKLSDINGNSIAYNKEDLKLRIFSPAKINSINIDKPSPQMIGSNIVFDTKVNSPEEVLYQYWVNDGQGMKLAQDYSPNSKLTWTPTLPGNYSISAYVKNKYSDKVVEDSKIIDYTIFKVSTVTNFSGDVVSPQPIYRTINFTATSNDDTNTLYKFWINENGNWKVAQDYSSNNKLTWKPTKPGQYTISVYAKNKYSLNDVDSVKLINYNITDLPKDVSLVTDLNTPLNTLTPVTITANTAGNYSMLYRFWLYDSSTDKWSMMQDYSKNNKVTWTPSKYAKYKISVYARDINSPNEIDCFKVIDYEVSPKKSLINAFTSDLVSPQPIYRTINFTATSNDDTNTLYKFWISENGNWKVAQDYSSNNKLTWKPTKPGQYTISVYSKNKYSLYDVDSVKLINYNITDLPKDVSLVTDLNTPLNSLTPVTITANTAGNYSMLYRFWLYDSSTDKWSMMQDYSKNNKVTWTPSKYAKYKISVYAKDINSPNEIDCFKVIDYEVSPKKSLVNTFTSDLVSPQSAYKTINFTATSNDDANTLYQFWINENGTWKVAQDYSTNNKFTWKPTKSGEYIISVYVKNKNSTQELDDIKIIKYKIS